ncbi:hypothetical protein [Mycobacteroides abscessus]|uniref:hypothetical protein n=1 Tax=Mycobacteroides abscessus TaxID=36809 RepID=UPI00104FF8EB|nr:hypothetical protein [Mycobacteroides abscessus]
MRNRRISARPTNSHPRSHRHLACPDHQTAAPPVQATAARHAIEAAERAAISDDAWWPSQFKD